MSFKSTFSGGKCYNYKWLRGLNSSSPAVWCQRSDGVKVTGKGLISSLSRLAVGEELLVNV